MTTGVLVYYMIRNYAAYADVFEVRLSALRELDIFTTHIGIVKHIIHRSSEMKIRDILYIQTLQWEKGS